MVAAEESGAAAAGSALNVFTSNSPFTFDLTDGRGWKERRRHNKNKNELLDQRKSGGCLCGLAGNICISCFRLCSLYTLKTIF